MKTHLLRFVLLLFAFTLPVSAAEDAAKKTSGNPIFPGWYADPEVALFGDTVWIYPTYSNLYEKQVFFDCFSSKDLVNWTKHEKVLTNENVKWAKKAMWAPAVIEKDGKYYFFFAANDVHEGEIGGIGVAVADKPDGPFKDLLGKPLINEIVNGAQPIDQFVYKDGDTYYMIYGGWRHCNIVKLKDDFTGLVPYEDGTIYKEITPENYVEGPFVFKKDGKYYFMWSEGGWGRPDYCVAYAISDSLFGPHKRIGKVMEQDPAVATGAGHHSVLHLPHSDQWYAIYHRRPLDNKHRDHRVTCIDKMEFDENGHIKPIKLTFEGVSPQKIADAVQKQKISGTITLDGDPIDGATITFTPSEKGQIPVSGKTNVQGNYEIELPQNGTSQKKMNEYKVSISKKDDGVELLPKAYASAKTTPLHVTVNEGPEKNRVDIEISSK